MIATQTRRGARRGFTLIELLVVMAIIGVLVGLLLSGVMAVLAARDRAQVKFEIGKLDEAMKTAMLTYGQRKSMPGKLVLYNNIAVYRDPAGNGVAAASIPDVLKTKDALRNMFGKRFIEQGTTVNWGGTSDPVTLQGQQCLVFYLGGMTTVAGTNVKATGFSIDPLNPTAAGGERIGPFYEFPVTRLVGGFGAPANFYSFADPHGTPYAYFGGTGAANNYTGDCSALVVGAYQEPSGAYTKPDSFQIISAGRDKRFAPGGAWDPRVGVSHPNGRDDLSNFSTNVLAAPAN